MLSRAIFTLLALLLGGSQAMAFPDRPITLIYPIGAPGVGENFFRVVAEAASKSLNTTIVVENRNGAGGRRGFQAIAAAAGDAHIITAISDAALVVQPLADPNFSLTIDKDYVPISGLAATYSTLLAHPSAPFRDLKGMIAYAKANPGKLDMGTGGVASSQHFALVHLEYVTKIKVNHVPYKGSGAMVPALLAGQVMVGWYGNAGAARANIDAGKLIGIAHGAPERDPSLPDVPTFTEAGVPGFTAGALLGLIGPPGSPQADINILGRATVDALRAPEVVQYLKKAGWFAQNMGPADYRKRIESDLKELEPVIRETGFRIN